MRRTPKCPRCDLGSTMYRWSKDKNHWYCSMCMIVWDMDTGKAIGGQEKLV